MTALVVDASVAIKWLVPEAGTEAALELRRFELHAPDLLLVECANVLWKKTRRRELTTEEAELAAALLERADITLHAAGPLMQRALQIAGLLDHAVYDCFYLALAEIADCAMVTADDMLCRKLPPRLAGRAVRLLDSEAVLNDRR